MEEGSRITWDAMATPHRAHRCKQLRKIRIRALRASAGAEEGECIQAAAVEAVGGAVVEQAAPGEALGRSEQSIAGGESPRREVGRREAYEARDHNKTRIDLVTLLSVSFVALCPPV